MRRGGKAAPRVEPLWPFRGSATLATLLDNGGRPLRGAPVSDSFSRLAIASSRRERSARRSAIIFKISIDPSWVKRCQKHPGICLPLIGLFLMIGFGRGEMELGGCLVELLQRPLQRNRYPVGAGMREYGRTPQPGGGLALLGSLPREEDYGSQKFGEARKEHSTADKASSGGGASAEARPEGRTGGHSPPG